MHNLQGIRWLPVALVSLVVLAADGQAAAQSKDGGTADKSSKEMKKTEYMVLGEYVNPEDSLPRLRYFADGLESLNDRCAVRKIKLNPKMQPVYVNGRPVGFC